MPELSAGPARRYLLFSVDTEPDDFHWRGLHRGGWTHENLRGLGRLAEVCRDLGVKPTFFMTHSVAMRGEAAWALRPLLHEGLGEVGGHLHPGDTPPFGDWDLRCGDNILRLPDDLLAAKFSVLHGEIGSRFGRPTSYRSAAWALDARVVGLLERHGYLADSSVTPGVSWRLGGRPSYLGAPRGAYRLDAGDLSAPGAGPIVEVPVSIWSPRAVAPDSAAGRYLGDLLTMPLVGRKGMVARMLKAARPRAPAWLRPAFKSLPELENVARHLRDEEYLHVMCHSNELWPGTSPYVSDAAALDEFYLRLLGIFRFALAQGYIPVTVSEYARLFPAARAAGPQSSVGPARIPYPVSLPMSRVVHLFPSPAEEATVEAGPTKPAPPPARARRAILFAAKAAVSGLAMALAFSQVDWQEVGRILSGVDLAFAAACLSARVLLMGLNAWKLVFLLKPSTIAPGLVFRLNFMKALFNNLLPGGVGGEGVRMLLLGKETGSLGRASAAVIADRLTGLWMQVIFTSVSVPFLPVLGGPWTRFLAAAATGMLGLSAGLLALGPGPRLVGAALRRFPGRGADLLAAEAGNFRAFFHGLPAGPGRIAGLVAYCLASQVLLMVVLYLGARALGGSLIPAQIAPILLATALASLVPFTLGGLGVAEGASALAFSLAGSTAELGLLTALLMRALGMVPALIGAVLFLLTGLL